LLDEATVDSFQLVQGVSVSETWTSAAAMPRRFARSASQRAKNVFPAPYSPRTALKTAGSGHAIEFLIDGPLEPLHPDGKQVQPRLRHRPPPQRVDHFGSSSRADRG
jgi:hypothetical protein